MFLRDEEGGVNELDVGENNVVEASVRTQGSRTGAKTDDLYRRGA
jgi:hypothetical protein